MYQIDRPFSIINFLFYIFFNKSKKIFLVETRNFGL